MPVGMLREALEAERREEIQFGGGREKVANVSVKHLQGVSKKTLFSGFYTPGGHATISRDVDQSKTMSNTLYWLDTIFLY